MTSMSFSWEVSSSNLYYNARLKDNNNINQSSYVLSTGSVTYTNLIPDTNYYAYVETRNLYCSQGSDVVMDRTLPAKVNVSTIAKNATTITVSWNMSSVDLYYYIASLKERQDGPNIQSQMRTTLPGNVTFTGLVPGRNYFVFVTIYIRGTNTISVNFTERTLPPKPTLSITANTMTTMTVSWATPASDVDYYLVYLRETANGTLVKTNNVTSRPTTFNELVPGRNYSFSIEAHSADLSQLSDAVMSRTLPPKVNVTISVSSPTALTVSWVAPISDVDYYVVYLSETYNATAVKSVILSSTITTQAFTDLVPGRRYNASVTVYSGINSQSSYIVMNITFPPQVNVTVIVNSPTAMTVSWVAPTSDIDYYMVYLNETYNATAVKSFILPSTVTSQTFTNLVPGRNYNASVTVYNGINSQPSVIVTKTTFPVSSYIILNITSKTTTTMTVSRTTYLPDFFYWAYLRETASGNLVTTFQIYSNDTTFTGLVPGRYYSVSVEAYNGSISYWSDVMDRTLPPQVNVTVIVNSPTAMTVSWVAPTSDVDYYVVYLNETYNATAVKSFILPSYVTTQAFTDLVPGRSYNASVTVYSGINSQPSVIVTKITYMSIRLAGSNTACQGRVEVFHNGGWGTVCDDFWSSQDAQVVCHQLGCGLNGVAISNAYFGEGSVPIFLDDVQCSGYETQLSDCSHRPWGIHNCFHSEDASVICLQVSSYIVLTIMRKTTTTMTVSGTTYLPDSFSYWAYLRETASGNLVTTFQIYSNVTTFTGLAPGRNYSVSVRAFDGSVSYWSDVVMDRTLSSYIVLTIMRKTTTTMTVSGTTYLPDSFSYWAYLRETASGNLVTTFQIYSNVTTFTGLVPGRNYSVSVWASDGSVSYWSDVVMDRTLSSDIVLTITSKTTTTITVSGTTYLPDSFSYWAYLRETVSGSLVTRFSIYTTTATFTGLVPGMNYSMSVEATNGSFSIWSDVVMSRTYPASVKYFSCFPYSTENISCSWSLPDGVWSMLLLQVIKGSDCLQVVGIFNDGLPVITIYPSNEKIMEPPGNGRTNVTFAMLGRLKPNTEYLVNITTFSGDLPSQTLQGKAQTDISAPPPVLETVNITMVQNQVTPSSLTISFNCSWFQNTNGDLKYYTVIVKQSEGTSSESPEKRWPLSTYSEYASGITNVYQVDDRVYPSECSNPKSVVSVQIGTGRTSGSFSDGPLKQNTAYRISFRVYTYLPNARSVRAIYTDTRFSLPLMTVGGIGSSGSIIGPVVGGVLGALVIIAGGVLLYVRRERLNCFKRPDSIQKTSTRKWDDLPAIPSGMKNDVCDASHKAYNEYVNCDDCIYEDLDNGKPQEEHHSGTPSKTEDDAKTMASSDPTYLAPDNTYVNVK
ncbi:receptor-type tyrosine-protein phosphatase beta-like [Petromyzon marinus]|uniref:receptor-type tyrosine-protein phosphatase beta-like n=1 Tax=Petromyzon marinus TaxID=7757 RepID=UPI003F7229EA